MAGRWSKVLEDPEMAAWTMMAFSNASGVMISEGLIPASTRLRTCFPAAAAAWRISFPVAGIRAVPGSIIPRASAMTCMVEAVPMNEQAPQEGQA